MIENGFLNPMRRIEIRLLDALRIAANDANPLNSAWRHCKIGKITIKRDMSTTFHHSV